MSARRALWHLLVALVATLFVTLGFWQLGRHEGRVARNAILERRVEATPAPFFDLTATLDPDAAPGTEGDASFRPVTIEGTFQADHEVLLRGRAYEEQPGFHVLTPLAPAGNAEGPWVLVDRGWIPFQYDDPVLPAWTAPAGVVTVRGWLEPEADDPVGPLSRFTPRDPAEGPLERVARADVDRLNPQLPVPLEPFLIIAGALETSDGAVREGTTYGRDGWVELPVLATAPQPRAGSHLGYALQWWSFAIITVVGYAALLRRNRAAR